MPLLEPPWSVPYLISRPGSIMLMPGSTASLPVLNPDEASTAAYYNNLTTSEPTPNDKSATAPRVGRPDRGKRSTVKAARRAARRK